MAELDNTYLTSIPVSQPTDVKTALTRLNENDIILKMDGFKVATENNFLKFRVAINEESDVIAVTAAGAEVLRDALTDWLNSLV